MYPNSRLCIFFVASCLVSSVSEKFIIFKSKIKFKALKTSRFKHLLEVGRVFLTETDSHGRYRGSCDRASASAMHWEENCQSVDQTATLFTNSATI